MVMLGFKWPPLTGLKAKMNNESRMKYDTPLTRGPRNVAVEKTPAAVVGGTKTAAVAGVKDTHTEMKVHSVVPAAVSLSHLLQPGLQSGIPVRFHIDRSTIFFCALEKQLKFKS